MFEYRPYRFYRHKKGGIYERLFETEHSETLDYYVVYRGFYNDRTWIRPLRMFYEPGRFIPITSRWEIAKLYLHRWWLGL